MIQLVFLASIRERLGCEQQSFELPQQSLSVVDLIELLSAQGDVWKQALQGGKVLVAINQQMSKPATLVHDGDEVAFFPPVTGG